MTKTKKNHTNKKINFKYNMGVFWSFVRKYKASVVLLIFLITLIELSRISEKFLFKEIIDRGTDYGAGILLASVLAKILVIIAVLFVISVIVKAVSRWIYMYYLNKLDSHLMKDLKNRFFNHIISLDHDFHTTHKTGSLISRLGRGSGAMETMVDVFVMNFIPMIIQLIVVMVSIIYFDPVSALIVFITALVFILYSYKILKMQEPSKVELNKTWDIEKGNIADFLTNIESIRYFGKEKLIKSKATKLTENCRRAQMRNWSYFKWFDAGQIVILGTGIFFLMLFPIRSFLAGNMTLGTLAFIYTAFANLAGSLFGFVWGIRGFYRAMADFQDLFEYGKIEKVILDKPGAEKLKVRHGEIVFNNIEFSYGKRKMFRNFKLKVPKDQKVALVGHSGCGKSTLVKLLYRLHDVEDGEIMIDGKGIKEFTQESLRNEMSIVPQECVLFDDTIYNNIKFSKPDASRKEVMKAIRFAQLDQIIKEFPKQENTIVGERGVKLSGGEKQRVSIARAILADKKILVLDEATSALDSETEHEIQRDLEKLMKGRTSIIIAHRLSTIMHADKIVVMRRGKIIETGKHNKLVKQNGEYKKLWNLQKGGYIK
ncbi:ABC transporter ATP-binding protein [Candidatus Pacearchaeota archaeon]|nr:ABC transporter ATP-binding protein [Candidatus Pacearchaeota archaeon]